MKAIAKISEKIRDEIQDAEDYARLGAACRASDVILAAAYKQLAEEELSHVDRLHAQVVRLIDEVRATGKTVPAGMNEVYAWEHEKAIDDTARVRELLRMI